MRNKDEPRRCTNVTFHLTFWYVGVSGGKRADILNELTNWLMYFLIAITNSVCVFRSFNWRYPAITCGLLQRRLPCLRNVQREHDTVKALKYNFICIRLSGDLLLNILCADNWRWLKPQKKSRKKKNTCV